MRKGIVLIIIILANLLMLGSCGIMGGRTIFDDDGKRADPRMEQIVSAIKNNDKEALKSLFSEKALEEAVDFDTDLEYLFDFIQGDIDSWERDSVSSDGSIRSGRKSLMIRFLIALTTGIDEYHLYVIDYATDTIDSDNQGLYMLEVCLADSPNTGSWQERMRAGLYIH